MKRDPACSLKAAHSGQKVSATEPRALEKLAVTPMQLEVAAAAAEEVVGVMEMIGQHQKHFVLLARPNSVWMDRSTAVAGVR